ncbi:MAG: hypothetical protein CALGDGBN_00157 [Pseudomonadales bacterium]|nr:hypothetical protein [Pseudomonadales bacterium]
MNAEVVVYGASGYTGKLIAWQLAERGIPFIAAGRNAGRLAAEMAKVPELDGARYECVAVDHDEAALTKLFTGRKAVCNVVGPFMQLGEPVVKACLAAGCHYLDTTGEQDWMLHLQRNYGEAFARKGLLLVPACSWMWLAGQLAAELALEHPGIDTLDIAYMADSNTSVASTMSFLRMLTREQYFLEHGALCTWPSATAYPISIPGVHRVLDSLPWGGGGEPVWYANDPRVASCSVLVAFRNQDMLRAIVALLVDFEQKHRHLPVAEQEQITNTLGNQLVSSEPGREVPARNRSIVSCHGRGDTGSVTVVLRGNAPYIQTGIFVAEAMRTILLGRQRGQGFTAPAAAFGAREMIAAAAAAGQLAWEATPV